MAKRSGGPRKGSGRPSSSVAEQRAERSVQTRLRSALAIVMAELEPSYRELAHVTIQGAIDGDKMMRRFFLELPFKYAKMDEVPDSVFTKARETWVKEESLTRITEVEVEPSEGDTHTLPLDATGDNSLA